MLKFILCFILFSSAMNVVVAQVVINEASNRNYKQIIDEDGEYNDWIELYNADSVGLKLTGWALSDSKSNVAKWPFHAIYIPSGGFLLIHASGKDKRELTASTHWESAVLPDDDFSYLVPTEQTQLNWYHPDFDDQLWAVGKAGFGFADEDDQTVFPDQPVSIFLRTKFNVPDTSAIVAGIFHADYDDGFIAYLNGVEIARSNMGENAQWNSLAILNHEAVMYSGGIPESFEIDSLLFKNNIRPGENTLCVQVHNVEVASSDLSIIPFLSFELKDDSSFFRPTPNWFLKVKAGLLHANFKLSSEGEKIYLSKDSVIRDSLYVPDLMLDHSVGRVTDGAINTGIFTTATPGGSNNLSKAYTFGYTSKPEFSVKAGFYSSSFDVKLTTTEENATIRYTIDGSDPTEKSAIYSAPLKIITPRSLRARAFTPEKLPGEIATATYFIKRDYTVPVLSVTTDNSNLYGNEGIFSNLSQSWNVPSYVEYFDNEKNLAFNFSAGMQVDGGAGGSRTPDQCSFRIEPGNSTFGEGDLKYKLIHRRPNRTNYPSFYVRNGSNQHLVLPYKDALEVTALGRNTYTYYSAYQPIVVYINGQYFGAYELREKINDDYLQDNYQIDIDSLDFLGVSYFKGQKLEALRGSIDPFIDDYNRFQQMDNKSANYVDEVGKFLDLLSYTDYIIAQSWVANTDWPYNNIKLFRCKGTQMKWRWAINDLEWSLNPNGWTTSSFDHIQFLKNQGSGNYYTGFWYNLMLKAEYKAYFVNRFADLMNTNYNFSVIGPLENEMYNEILPEMKGEYERWGNSNITSQLNTFTRNHEIFRTELQKRNIAVRKHLQTHYGLKKQTVVTLDVEPKGSGSIQISTVNPPVYPWNGIYFTNIQIEVTAIPNLGYEFANWDENNFVENLNEAALTGKFTDAEISFKAHFRAVENSNQGVMISEINFKQGKELISPDWIEICNLGADVVNLKNWYFTDKDSSNRYQFPDDYQLTSNQRMVISNNYQKFNELYPSSTNYLGEFLFGLGTPSDEIHLYNDRNEEVASVNYSDIYPWALSDDFSGRTLELRSPHADLSNPTSWFRGCIGGSPGVAYQACDEQFVSAPVVVVVDRFDVSVYPNPAHNFVEVDILLEEEVEFCDLTLFSPMGDQLQNFSLGNLQKGRNTAQLDLSGIQANLLILKVSTSRNQKSLKIVKVE